ncbi:MAG TPA: NADPH:quinone oxidoreductase family protein [Terriglobales bacterium]|nr:NADPH:quinone oxidoreductase family protein [Terriglobales bacterium]
MRAIVVTGDKGPESLELREVAEPKSGTGDVVVNVKAAGVNFADVRAAQGKYPGGPEAPFVAGREYAGTVGGTGERVMGYSQHSAFAERIVTPRELIFPAPAKWDFEHCAAFPVNYLTAWLAYWKAGLVRGVGEDPSSAKSSGKKRVLIHAAAGGVGTAAVEIGKQLGIETLGTASTGEKLARLKELGLTHGINYTREDYEERVKEITRGEGVDAVFDGLGGEHTGKSVRCLGFLGRVILFGSATGEQPKVNLGQLYLRGTSIHGLWLSKLVANAELIRSALESMKPWIESGAIEPQVGAVLPMEEAADAYRMLLERRNYGKVVLKV